MGLRENKLLTSEESVLPEKRFLETLMLPAPEKGVFRTAYHSFGIHLEVVQRMLGKGESMSPVSGLSSVACHFGFAKWPGWASGLCSLVSSSLGYSCCALW